MSRILILGGNGFIGRNLASHLSDEGYEIHICDKFPFTSDKLIEFPYIEYIGDITDRHFLHSCLQKGPFDRVIHLACSLIPSSGFNDFQKEQDLNLLAGFELVNGMLQHGSKKLMFFSTGGAIYGNNGQEVNSETSVTAPINYYGFSKLAMEEYIRFQSRNLGLDYVIVRPSNPYGSGQNLYGKQGLIAVTLGKLIQEQPVEIWGDGNVVRDYIHIQDLCRGIEFILKHPIQNEILNIGSGVGSTVNEVLEKIRLATQQNFPVKYLPSRAVDTPTNILNVNKINTLTGWQAKIELEKGIEELWREMLVSLPRS